MYGHLKELVSTKQNSLSPDMQVQTHSEWNRHYTEVGFASLISSEIKFQDKSCTNHSLVAWTACLGRVSNTRSSAWEASASTTTPPGRQKDCNIMSGYFRLFSVKIIKPLPSCHDYANTIQLRVVFPYRLKHTMHAKSDAKNKD